MKRRQPETGNRVRDAWPALYDWPAWMVHGWLEHGRDVAMFIEGTSPSSIPVPGFPSAYLSQRCADFPESQALTRSLVQAATKQHNQGANHD